MDMAAHYAQEAVQMQRTAVTIPRFIFALGF